MKKIFKYFFLTLLGAIIFLAGYAAFSSYRPDVMAFKVNRYIATKATKWGTLVELTPDIFQKDISLDKVNKRLLRAGYLELPQDDKDTEHFSSNHSGINKHIFHREAGTLICNIHLYVFIETDNEQKLKKASGTQTEHGCL